MENEKIRGLVELLSAYKNALPLLVNIIDPHDLLLENSSVQIARLSIKGKYDPFKKTVFYFIYLNEYIVYTNSPSILSESFLNIKKLKIEERLLISLVKEVFQTDFFLNKDSVQKIVRLILTEELSLKNEISYVS